MTRTHTMQRAVKEAAREAFSSPEICSREVIRGPLVTAYQNLKGQVRLDVIDHGLVFPELTETQALAYADVFFDYGLTSP